MLTTEKFITKAKEKHGDKYYYNQSLYVKSKIKLIIRCPMHGNFEQLPNNHLSGHGCPKCAFEAAADSYLKSQEQFIEESKLKHENKYDYSLVKYFGAKKSVTIICPIHGEFSQNANKHVSGRGCYKCGRDLMGDKQKGDKNCNWNSNREYIENREKIARKCKQMLKYCLSKLSKNKTARTHELLGYTREQLKEHLCNHLNWSKVKDGDWHLDHIFPISAFIENGICDLKIINALENLQPLSKKDNLSKNDNYDIEMFKLKYKDNLKK